MKKRTIKYLDLFSGAGGLSYGLSLAGLKGVIAIEKNEDAFKTYNYNILEKGLYEWPKSISKRAYDIEDFYNDHIDFLLNNKDIDLIAGGPPCQGFSMAGKRNRSDTRNELSYIYIKYIEILKPKMIFLENVEGYNLSFSEQEQSVASIVEAKLSDMGYSTYSKIINMADYGIPQLRKRYILFACKDFEAKLFFEKLERVSERFLRNNNLCKDITVDEAIGDLKKGKQRKKEGNFIFGKYRNPTSSYQVFMRRNVLSNSNPNSHRFVNHSKFIISKFKRIMKITGDSQRTLTPDERKSLSITKRNITALKKGNICRTITSIPDDYVHYIEPRVMTPRECARIQGFPDDFHFLGKYTTGGELRKFDVPRYTQIANAIPPLFSFQVGLTVKELLNDEQTSI